MQSPLTKFRTLAAGIAALALTPAVSFADSIDPLTYADTLAVGESVTITKTVTITQAPPTSAVLDVMFLMDTTGSMGAEIAAAKSAASTILSDLAAFGDLASGTAYFNDSPANPSDWTAITSALSTNAANTQVGINRYTVGSPSNGGDFPEEGFLGIRDTVNDTAWRAGSNRFVVMFGDANDGFQASQASAAAALAGENVTLIGVSYSSAFTNQYGATAVVSGGSMNAGSTSGSALATIIQNAVTASFASYSSVCLDTSGAPAGVGVTTSPTCYNGSYDRSRDRDFVFDVTFTGVTPGTYTDFPITALVDGGIVATELDTITVTSSVPEPGALGLLGLSLVLLTVRRRKLVAA